MILKKKPATDLPNPYVPPGAEQKYVAGSPASSWTSIASELGLNDVWKDLIEFNFPNVAQEKSLDDKCRAVNWLLETRVGCTQSKDGKNYSFEGAQPGYIYVPKTAKPPKPKTKPTPPNYSLLSQFLLTDPVSAKMLAPATIVPFPNRSEEYVRQRLAAAVRVARYTHLGLSTLAGKSNRVELWNGDAEEWGLGCWWFGAYSDRKFEKVLASFGEIQWILADPRLKVICKPNLDKFGSALPGIRKIKVGADWVTPAMGGSGPDEAERVQTFVHEAAHIAGRVFAGEFNHYGRDAAHGLTDSGMRATRSADNYGYYAIDVALAQQYPRVK
jgi:hypothetical protein